MAASTGARLRRKLRAPLLDSSPLATWVLNSKAGLAFAITSDAVADALEAAERLDVVVDHFAWLLALVAHAGSAGSRLKLRRSRKAARARPGHPPSPAKRRPHARCAGR